MLEPLLSVVRPFPIAPPPPTLNLPAPLRERVRVCVPIGIALLPSNPPSENASSIRSSKSSFCDAGGTLVLAFCEELEDGRCVAVKNEEIGLFAVGAFFCKGAVDFLVVPLGFAGVLLLAFGFSGAGHEVFLIALVCEGEGFSVTASFAAGGVEPAAARRVEALVFLCGAEDDKGAIDASSSK